MSTVKGRAWSLQARLMVAIIGIVALIIVGIAFAISAFLGQILQDNLTAKVNETAQETAAGAAEPAGTSRHRRAARSRRTTCSARGARSPG